MSKRQSAAAVEERPADEKTFTVKSVTVSAAMTEEFRTIPLAQLVPSTTNPRTHFDETRIADLARSLAEKGCIEPIVVRRMNEPDESFFEIVAGERRYRAAKLAALAGLLAVIRPYTDEQVLEIQLLENISRSDLTPLEQARGFRALIAADPDKHNIHTIASRVGMSPAWVWDRVNLLNLLPALQQLLEQERISIGHAIVLARLKPEDQDRVANPENGGLWRDASGARFDLQGPEEGNEDDPYDGCAPVTIRELEQHIARHVRFDVEHAAQAQPLQFDELATRVEAKATERGRGKKVIPITYEYQLPRDARSDERTYSRQSWKRADGVPQADPYSRKSVPSPTCEHAVLGLVVAGAHYGEAFEVCIAKDRCEVHWKKEIAEKRNDQQLREGGEGVKAPKKESAAQAKQDERRREQEQRQDEWRAVEDAVIADAVDQVRKAKSLTPAQAKFIERGDLDVWGLGRLLVEKLGKTWFKMPAAAWLVIALSDPNQATFDDYVQHVAKPLGLDVKRLAKIRDAHVEPKTEASAPAKAKKGGQR